MGGVNVERAGKEKRGKRKKKMRNLFSQNLWLKMAKHFSALLQSHIGNPPRPWKRNTLALLQKWACLWLFLISGFVCGASGSSCGFAGDPQAFCLISRGGFCSAPAAICWHTPFVLPRHARLGHRLRITGNTAIRVHRCLFPLQQLLALRKEAGNGSPYESEKVRCVERVKNNNHLRWEMKSLAKYALFSTKFCPY